MFIAAFDDINYKSDITYAHAANSIAAFEGTNWRASNSAFDRYLRGERKAMSLRAREGMKLFYKGKRGDKTDITCASCHSGSFQTDHSFHAIAMPQIGAGKGDGLDGHEDFGRERVSFDEADRYKFRTPTLRNVALTAPYGHAGTYNSLRAVVEHHIDTVNALFNYDQSQAVLPPRKDLDDLDFIVMDDAFRLQEIANANEIPGFRYKDKDIDRIIDFLNALTDPDSIDLRNDIPASVPSGLPLAE
jgi:cytochrome c peroxidase